jgi:hypothetical protein
LWKVAELIVDNVRRLALCFLVFVFSVPVLLGIDFASQKERAELHFDSSVYALVDDFLLGRNRDKVDL